MEENLLEVEKLKPQLVEALQIVMNSASPRDLRANANNFIDDFKENSPYCVECGFHLILQGTIPVIRHFGLVLIEHCIKYQWNNMTLSKKVYIKDNLMRLLASGTGNLLEEFYYIKNGLAKNIVEIIKREWPQQWPGLLDELYTVSAIGETQAELVLYVFLVLAEDVVILNNAQSQRRREIYQSLVSNLDQLFPFFTKLLMNNAHKYLVLKTSNAPSDEVAASVHCQVANSTLETIAEYIDWIPINYIITENGILLQMLCELLTDAKLKYSAIKCVLVLTSRKGKTSDRVPILKLFDQVCLNFLFKAAALVEDSATQEQSYSFLKNICQSVFSLGSQLHALYGVVPNLELPITFSTYLDVLLELSSHPSLIICHQAITVLNSFMQHKLISKNLILLSHISPLVEKVAPKLIKVGFPSKDDNLSCNFSKLDYDSDDDFLAAFSKLRIDCVSLLRLFTTAAPEVTFTYTSQWLIEQVKKPIDPNQNQTLKTSLYLSWDALSVCLESVISKSAAADPSQSFKEEGIRLTSLLLSISPEDPLILSSWLSCISALFPFVKHSSVVVQSVLDAVFRAVVFSSPGQSRRTRSKAVKNVRRHGCSCLVKLCKLYPAVFEPLFDHIFHFVKVNADTEHLSQLEKCTLVEALILIKNQCNNYEKQSLFIQDILSPVANIWLSDEIKLAFSSVNNFMTYVGLHHFQDVTDSEDVYGTRRSRIMGSVELILAVIKRSTWPEDIELAQKGGFVARNDGGELVYRNPAQEYLFPLYSHVFYLLKILNDIWLPQNLEGVAQEYKTINEMSESDKNNLLGIAIVNSSDHICKDSVERLKTFITGLYDTCHQIIGQSGINLGPSFYFVPNLVNFLLLSLCSNLELIPDHRLRSLVRFLLKPLLQHCPAECYQSVAIPFLTVFCSHMDHKFHTMWAKHFEKCFEIKDNENDHAEAQEVIEEQLHRHMTREYLELLTAILLIKPSNSKNVEPMEDDEMTPAFVNSESKLSELGKHVFSCKELYPSILLTIFDVLVWVDNTSCLKSLQLCLPIIRQLAEDKNLGVEEARYLFRCLLLGLQKHGQHDSSNYLLSVGYQAYEIMLPIHPSLSEMLLQICDGAEQNLKNFDEIILNQNRNKAISEKKKKDLFKTLVIGIVEKSVGEIFSRKAIIKDLPPAFRQPKPKIKLPDYVNVDMGLCALFNIQKP